MGKLTISKTEFSGVYVIDTEPFVDDRGAFARWFCTEEMKTILNGKQIKNVNFSKTLLTGTVRGMHFQYPPCTETKIVRCIKGKIKDIIVDIRKNSPTFLNHFEIELSENNMRMLYVPEGFAHGFQSLEDDSQIMYLVTELYSSEYESGLNPLDPKLNINWPLPITLMSEKDKKRKFLDDDFEGIN